jgi:hypothetical protein
MMKMTNTRTLRETAARMKELAGKLEWLLTEDAGGKPRIKINAGALFDTGVNQDDLYALIDISSCADDESGITGRIRPGYRARSMRKLEARGYVKKIFDDESAHIYMNCAAPRGASSCPEQRARRGRTRGSLFTTGWCMPRCASFPTLSRKARRCPQGR